MKVVLVGGSGFLGTLLGRRLTALGHDVAVLGRRASASGRPVHWDGRELGPWAAELDGADAIVHLAGKRVDCRPTERNVAQLIESRAGTVELVGRALETIDDPPSAWIQLSSLAIYGATGDEIIDETSPLPNHGLPQQVGVCRRWEAAFATATAGVPRAVLLRAGITIGGTGDPATEQLARLARWGLGGPVADGRQRVSWIGVDDMGTILERVVLDESMSGLYLATGPTPVRNADLMAAYRRAVGRRFGLPSPGWATRIGATLLGSDPALALTGRRCVPRRLLDEGFEFAADDIDAAVTAAVAAID